MQTPSPEFELPRHALGADAQADLDACRATLREGSYTFFAASLILPRAVREPASALYAFCRMADDEVDTGADKQAAVASLRARLHATYSGRARALPCDRALAAVVQHFAIPRELPEALLDGFAWDAEGRRYETIEDLHGYAARVAGTVGAMMALLMGVRSAEGLARACDLGVAMQLSNIARDVGEDARMGRIYLPLQWLREAGVQPDAWLAQPQFNPAIASVVRRLLDEADRLYQRVDDGVARLPLGCRPGINAARYLYAAIGHEVARRGLNSVDQRAVVPRARKARQLARAVLNLAPGVSEQPAPCLPANEFLVTAAMAAALPAASPAVAAAQVAWWRIDERLAARYVRVLELFERLERRDRNEGMTLVKAP
jgi:phytoene synthase